MQTQRILLTLIAGFWLSNVWVSTVQASAISQTKGSFVDKFRQLDETLPTPNVYRAATGEPGEKYWQQRADYQIKVRLDEQKRRIEAYETIRYYNNSPHTLKYIWIQLDQNIFKNDSMAELTATFNSKPTVNLAGIDGPARLSLNQLRRQQFMADNELGFSINKIVDGTNKPLDFVIVGTNLRIDLPRPISSGQRFDFAIDFAYNMVEEDAVNARSGYENFPNDAREGGNDIFLLEQWYPRVAAFTDYEGWTNKEFLGSGEFTMEFGDFEVAIDVPADHIVSASGVLQNPQQVLTKQQRERLKQFSSFSQGYQQGGNVQPLVMAMSFYPKEGGELWEKYSTASVIHTMEVYSRFSFDYPYPTAQSVNGPVGGMEYPMITFNGPRTVLQDDGSRTYSLAEKRFLIGVVIHEIGHIYFPMIVNSDERQWTWMDEGLNSFLDGIAGREWDPSIPWGAEPRSIIDYMKSTNQVPIMTQSDSVLNLGPNAYTKPAVALNILREVVMGRELFDYAFKEYAQRWAFKRPTPADFFRTMEEASGIDLDWFWRGWFYSTDHVDISLERVYKLRLDTQDPDIDWQRRRDEEQQKPTSLFVQRNAEEARKTWVELNPTIRDFHDDNDEFTVTNKQRSAYQEFLAKLEPWERRVFERAVAEDKHYYVLDFNNLGGLVMPIVLQTTYADGSTEMLNIPAEIWRRNAQSVSKLIITDKPVQEFAVDPNWETADVDISNNYYPRRMIESRIEAFKSQRSRDHISRDLMQEAKTELKKTGAPADAAGQD
jgi:hypothetical protein